MLATQEDCCYTIYPTGQCLGSTTCADYGLELQTQEYKGKENAHRYR